MLDLTPDSAAPKTTRLADYAPPPFLIDTVDLDFDLGEDTTLVTARCTIRRNPASPQTTAPLELDGEAISPVAVKLDGDLLGANRYRAHEGGLVVPDVPEKFTLEITTRIKPQENTELSGLYTSGGNFCTQCEAEGFRRITYFPDRPDVMARFTTRITAAKDRYPVLLSNGNPEAQGELPGGRHWARWVDPHPKPAYLFALVAGDLIAVRDSFKTRSGKDVALAIWVRRGDEDKCGHAMESLKHAMKWDEDVFGLEYDLEVFNIVAVSDFNMGAMENKGLNIFNTKFILANPRTATDIDYQSIEAVVAHEYFHNWTGNRVTCRDWFQLSLKEGLTVFRDQEFSADRGSRAVRRIATVRRLRAAQFPEDAGPLAHPVRPDSYIRIDNFYTPTVYEKGAEVVRVIHTLIGKAAFRRGMDLYFKRNDNGAATVEDFLSAMQDASGIDLEQVKRWYVQAGTPSLTAEDHYDPVSRTYRLDITQQTAPTPGQPTKQPMLIPIAMGLLAPDGTELPTRLDGESQAKAGTRVLTLAAPRQSFRFVDVPAPPVASLLRGFSAPVKLKSPGADQLAFLARHDSDAFARWEAGQQIATRALLDMVAAQRRGETLKPEPLLIDVFRRALANAERDPAFTAEVLMLPGEMFLGDQMAEVDVDAIHAARDFARRTIAQALQPELESTYGKLSDSGPYGVDGPAIARRSLRNTCLGYLAATGSDGGIALAVRQFESASNMTDMLAALVVLADADRPERDAALAKFYADWQREELVVDKWFSVQAQSSLPGTLSRVKALLHHKAYDMRNPNRLRALVSAFAQGNQVRFHDASGAGYAFLADQIMALDPVNAMVAARIASPLAAWRRHEPVRRAAMQRELQRILALPNLSKNVYEVASKSLG